VTGEWQAAKRQVKVSFKMTLSTHVHVCQCYLAQLDWLVAGRVGLVVTPSPWRFQLFGQDGVTFALRVPFRVSTGAPIPMIGIFPRNTRKRALRNSEKPPKIGWFGIRSDSESTWCRWIGGGRGLSTIFIVSNDFLIGWRGLNTQDLPRLRRTFCVTFSAHIFRTHYERTCILYVTGSVTRHTHFPILVHDGRMIDALLFWMATQKHHKNRRSIQRFWQRRHSPRSRKVDETLIVILKQSTKHHYHPLQSWRKQPWQPKVVIGTRPIEESPTLLLSTWCYFWWWPFWVYVHVKVVWCCEELHFTP